MLTKLENTYSTDDVQLLNAQISLKKFLTRSDIGFPRLPMNSQLWNSSLELAKSLRKNFDHIVIVGIGGSSLGVKAISQGLYCSQVSFIDNVDSLQFESVLENLKNPKKTLWTFISKSGTTIETLCALEFIEQWMIENQFGKLSEQSVVISENIKNTLTDWADKNKIPKLEIPLDVGGRFSVLSPVGMFPAAFLGLNIEAFRQGALKAIENTFEVENFVAQVLQSYLREERISLFWFYNSSLYSFGGWIQQLWAESLGKKIDVYGKPAHPVSTPMYAIGASDQHSILQQVMEGHRDKLVVFFRFLNNESGKWELKKSQFSETKCLENKKMGLLLGAEAEATEKALRLSGVSTLSYSTKVMDEKTLGYLFMFFQLSVAAIGEHFEINTFDQPGVELGKRLAKEKLNSATLSV